MNVDEFEKFEAFSDNKRLDLGITEDEYDQYYEDNWRMSIEQDDQQQWEEDRYE